MRPTFTLGIEEEYQTVDPESRDLRSHIATEMLEQGKLRLEERVKAELHQSVIEVGTRICHNIQEAQEDLFDLRRNMIRLAEENGLMLVAGATHPFADWRNQEIYPDPRYAQVVEDLQLAARSNLIFGLHVHVGVEDKEAAIRIMNTLRYFLPHIVALATNSPFWLGMDYRLEVAIGPRSLRASRAPISPTALQTSSEYRELCQPAGARPTASTTPRRSGGTSARTRSSTPLRFAHLRHCRCAHMRRHRSRRAHPGDGLPSCTGTYHARNHGLPPLWPRAA